MKSQRTGTAACVLLEALLLELIIMSTSIAQSTAPWDRQANGSAVQADAQFDGYKFRDGEILDHLRIHYATLGTPHRDTKGDVDNAVLILHWTARTAAPS